MTERSLFFGSASQNLALWPVAVPALTVLVAAPFVDPEGPHSGFALAVGQFSAISALSLLVFFAAMSYLCMDGWSRHRAIWSLKITTLWLFAITSIAYIL